MSDEPLPLFRAEALESNRPRAYGRVVLLRPLSFTLLTVVAGLIALTIVGFFIWGRYTQHTTLAGQLVPTTGVVGVRAPQPGTIIEKNVLEGDHVEKDQVLYLVSSELYSEGRGAVQEVVGTQLSLQEQSLLRQKEQTLLLESQERDALNRDLISLKAEHATLAAMQENARNRLELAAQILKRYSVAAERDAVSKEQLNNAQVQFLEVQTGLRGLEREDAGFARKIADTELKLASLQSRYASQLEDLERAVSTARRGLAENEARRVIEIRAPASGTAAAVDGEVGQTVDPSQSLLAIVPEEAELEAQLLAPTRSIGFVQSGSPVMIRYDAYPYQRFGHHRGEVRSVSRTVVSVAPGTASDAQGGDPVYMVRVVLPSQDVTAYGKQRRLQAGMTVQADILQDTRRLYEWVLEPLYSITGKLHSGDQNKSADLQ
jgi:membrane fusion protein